MRPSVPLATCLSATVLLCGWLAVPAAQTTGLAPGTRALLDAHNAYPYEGRFTDRLSRGLATGVPVALEQDLIWRVGPDGRGESVVGHDVDKVAGAPSFESYFFGVVGPVMTKALQEGRRDQWPLVILNLDFKTNEPAHHARVREVLGRHAEWLTTAPAVRVSSCAAPLMVGPLLVLTGSNAVQQRSFHDNLKPGENVWLFGAYEAPTPTGDTPAARAIALAAMTPEALMPSRATNYRRWVNFPWLVVEKGGQNHAADWTTGDRARLDALVARAHGQGLFIRFYTLNGHPPADAEQQGWSKSYNFGSLAAAKARWQAARDAKVDFIATDQYEEFSKAR